MAHDDEDTIDTTTWQGRARAAGATDDDVARLEADYVDQPDQEKRFLWGTWIGSLDDAGWAAQLDLLRSGWKPSDTSAPSQSGPDTDPGVGTVADVTGPDAVDRAERTASPGDKDHGASPEGQAAGSADLHVSLTTTPADAPVSLEDVPDGTMATVLEWVGGDPARARAALAVERQKDDPRSSLISKLESV